MKQVITNEQEKAKELQALLPELEIQNVPDEEEPPSLFTINGVEVLPPKAVGIVAAQKKSGKSNFAGILMAASASKDHQLLNGSIRSNNGQIDILVADTEQPLRDARRTYRRAMKSAGYNYDEQWNKHGITTLTLKDIETENERKMLIELAIQKHHPQLVIVDGIADLIQSINDETEAKRLMAWMDCLACKYDCAVVGMLHLNHNSDKIGGWAGTQANKKFTDSFILTKDKKHGLFTVEHEGRGECAPKLFFNIFCPMGDKIGWWQSPSANIISDLTKEDAEKLELSNLMSQAKMPCKNGELVAWIIKTKQCSKSHADKLLKKCKEYSILDSYRKGRESIWFMVTTSEPDTVEQELPLCDD